MGNLVRGYILVRLEIKKRSIHESNPRLLEEWALPTIDIVTQLRRRSWILHWMQLWNEWINWINYLDYQAVFVLNKAFVKECICMRELIPHTPEPWAISSQDLSPNARSTPWILRMNWVSQVAPTIYSINYTLCLLKGWEMPLRKTCSAPAQRKVVTIPGPY
jgi:hypothetical protein